MDRTDAAGVELVDLRMHPRHKELPGPDRESASWAAFVTALSGAGPEGIPALVVTPDNQIMDGERRFLAARQLGWERVPVVRRPESECAVILVDSLMGQRHLTKGAKVYLVLRNGAELWNEFVEAAERRRLEKLRRGIKTPQNPNKVPLAHSVRQHSSKAVEAMAERLGCSARLVEQALQVSRIFGLAGNHQFEFQDGDKRSLREHFEPQILDGEHPMGLGEVLKGCGWFVDEEGQVKNQKGPGERNSYLHYFEASWEKFNGQFARWEKLRAAERERALELVAAGIREWPAEMLGVVIEEGRRNLTQRRRGAEEGRP